MESELQAVKAAIHRQQQADKQRAYEQYQRQQREYDYYQQQYCEPERDATVPSPAPPPLLLDLCQCRCHCFVISLQGEVQVGPYCGWELLHRARTASAPWQLLAVKHP